MKFIFKSLIWLVMLFLWLVMYTQINAWRDIMRYDGIFNFFAGVMYFAATVGLFLLGVFICAFLFDRENA